MKSNVNIEQIATLAGYSKSTISKALNGSPEISRTTRRSILEIAKKYNYKPNNAAKSLKLRKANSIGLIIPEFSNVYCANLMEGISDEATRKGNRLVVYQSKNKVALKNKITGLLFDGSIDGLIIVTDERFAEKCEINFIEKVMNDALPSVKLDCSIFPERNASPLVTKTMGKEIVSELFEKINEQDKCFSIS